MFSRRAWLPPAIARPAAGRRTNRRPSGTARVASSGTRGWRLRPASTANRRRTATASRRAGRAPRQVHGGIVDGDHQIERGDLRAEVLEITNWIAIGAVVEGYAEALAGAQGIGGRRTVLQIDEADPGHGKERSPFGQRNRPFELRLAVFAPLPGNSHLEAAPPAVVPATATPPPGPRRLGDIRMSSENLRCARRVCRGNEPMNATSVSSVRGSCPAGWDIEFGLATKRMSGNERANSGTSRESHSTVQSPAVRANSSRHEANITWSPIPCSARIRTGRPVHDAHPESGNRRLRCCGSLFNRHSYSSQPSARLPWANQINERSNRASASSGFSASTRLEAIEGFGKSPQILQGHGQVDQDFLDLVGTVRRVLTRGRGSPRLPSATARASR